MQVTLKFSNEFIEYLNTKFDIKDEVDLEDAIREMVTTYMEM